MGIGSSPASEMACSRRVELPFVSATGLVGHLGPAGFGGCGEVEAVVAVTAIDNRVGAARPCGCGCDVGLGVVGARRWQGGLSGLWRWQGELVGLGGVVAR